jgi:phage-related protein
MAITVGSVEVDVVPNTRGIYTRLRSELTPAAARAGRDAGNSAGASFGEAMQSRVAGIGLQVGERVGQQIASRVRSAIQDSIRDGVSQGGASARPAATRQGQQTGSAFARSLRAQLEAALRDLPEVRLHANSTDAQREIYQLRSQMQALQNARIGIDLSTADAVAQIAQIQARLERLSADDANIGVRVDTAAAATQLAAIQAMVDRLDGDDAEVDVKVNTSGALAAVMQLGIAIAGLAAIPAVPVLAAGIGSIAAAGVAAGAGIGALGAVAVPAFVGIANALKAQKAAQDAATTASARGSQTAAQSASRALQMASAQQALATAHRNAARQIDQAEQGVEDAVRSAAQANQQAASQVRSARQALASAIEQAAERQQQATERIADAEDSLADAQRSARQAQQDLTRARREAALELAELGDRLANAQLDERDAALSVQEAEARLRELRGKGSKATLLEQQRAQLAYEQALQRLKEQSNETKSLTAEKAAADAAGVEGSRTVQDAMERLRRADEAVVDQQKALTKARSEAARQQVQSQRDIAEAQERVAESQRNVARVQEDGARSVARAQEQLVAAQQSAADSIASAQRQIASASLSAAGSVDQAAVAQAKYQAELAKLSPAARATYDAVQSLRTAFSGWAASLQPAVMPIFTRAINGLKNSLPGLTPFVLAAAGAISRLQDRVSAGFKSPWWKSFKKDLAAATGPAIEGLGIAFGRIFKGMLAIVQAFLPHMGSISNAMQSITARFANWATGLKGSPEFERFLAYSAEMAPILASALRDMISAVLNVAKALAPAATVLYLALGGLFRVIGSIAEHLPWLIQLIYAVWVATKLWTLAMIAFNLVMAANPITLIVIAIVALVAAVVYAYKNWTWFRDIVNAVWSAIQTAALWAWQNVLQPVFSAIWTALQTVGRWASWLWTNVLSPVFGFISTAARILLTAVVVAVLLPIIATIKVLAAIAMWLWDKAIGPAFRLIGAVAMWLWRNVISPVFTWIGDKIRTMWNKWARPAFILFKLGFQELGDKASWLWRTILSPVFSWIGDKAKWLWDNALKPAFSSIQKGVAAVGKSFEDAKNFIGKAWQKVEDLAKKPVRFVIDKVYNAGIVPTWNLVAGAFGAPKIKPMKTEGWATGGVLPGYTPGRDVHRFVSPTGGGLELSGGEAIMRPEFTRAVGAGFVSTMNRIATTRGASGVKAALAPALGGNPDTPVQRFADGGIFGWIGKQAAGAGSAVWETAKKGASWLGDTLERSARSGLTRVVNPLLASFPGADTDLGRMIRRIPTRILDAIFGFSKEADKRGAGDVLGGPRIQAALKWAKTQHGLPYQWGGNGNPSWDCSGFMSAIESVIRGQKPHRRWSTHAFNGGTPPGWVRGGDSAFRVGITHAGVGHTAGSLGKTKVESRGGDGVVVGPRARGYNDRLFTSWYGFQPDKYDSGGYLQPGLNLAYNGTGRPEPVFTTSQAKALMSRAASPMSGLQPGQPVTLVVQDGPTLHAYVAATADERIDTTVRALAPAIAGRRG